MTRTSTALPLLAVAVSLLSQNLGAACAKILFPIVGAQGATALRVGLAACLLVVIARPWRARVDAASLGNLILYGVTLGLMNLLIYQAFARIPIGIATAIEVVGPLTVVLLSSRHARDFVLLGLAAIGLGLLLPLGGAAAPLDRLGLAYAIGAAFAWALYIVFGKRVSSLPGGATVAWGMIVAALFTVPLGLAHAGGALLSLPILLAGLGVAALSSALPYSLEMIALRRLPRQVFGIFVSTAPAMGALAGFLVLGETLSPVHWIAIACIMIAAAGSAAGSPDPRPTET